jgi:hypothetical protein
MRWKSTWHERGRGEAHAKCKEKPPGKWPLANTRNRWEDNIKI